MIKARRKNKKRKERQTIENVNRKDTKKMAATEQTRINSTTTAAKQ